MLLTRLAVHRPVTTLMISLVVALLGVVSVERLAVDLLPKVDYPTVSVETFYRGAAPEEIETLLTRPLEQVLSSVKGTEELSSNSAEGVSNVRVRMTWGADLDVAVNDMRQAVQKIRQQLPTEVDGPFFRRYDESDSPIIYLGLESDLSPVETTLRAEIEIVPELEKLPGVGRVRLRGAVRREIQVDLDRQKLEALNLPVNTVVDSLRRQNVNQPAGDFDEGNVQRLVRSHGQFRDLDQIGRTIVREHEGAVVTINDIGRVTDGIEERTDVSRVNGQEGLLIYIHKQSDANTVAVSEHVRQTVEQLNRRLNDLTLSIRIDKSEFVVQSIENIRRSAMYGMGLAAVVLVVFLRSFRSTVVIGLSMPFSVLATFVLIYFRDFSLNMVSFGGLALGMGLLVDNSIVVLEAIFRRRDEGQPIKEAAVDGASEVGSAIVASTMTTLIVFLPLIFIGGMTGVLLHQLAWVVCFSLMCSLLASLTLTPMLAAHWGRAGGEQHAWFRGVSEWSRRIFSGLESAYGSLLRRALRRRGLVLWGLMLVFSAIVGLWPRIGSEYMPKADEGDLRVRAHMAPGIQLQHLHRQARRIEEAILRSIPSQQRQTVAAFIGGDRDDAERWNECWLRIKLVPRSRRSQSVEEVRQSLANSIGPIPGMQVRVEAQTEMMLARMLSFGGGDVEVEVRGHDLEKADRLADQVAGLMERVPGLVNINIERPDQRPELAIHIDRVKAGLVGVSVEDISRTLETTIRGTEATVFREHGDEFNVLVRLRDADRDHLPDIERVGVRTENGRIVALRDLVRFDSGNAPQRINRSDRQRVVQVSADVTERDLGSVVGELNTLLGGTSWPRGFAYRIVGDYEEQQKSFRELTGGLVLAVILMYMVMASQFESFRDPLVILVTIPLGAIGVILALVVTGTTLNAQSFIGTVMLAGIVVNNAIVLVDCINRYQSADRTSNRTEVIVAASVRRFRPILMTTLTTVLAMLPIAWGWGEGGELQAPMARVVIGGLLSGSLTTLLAIPIVCHLVRPVQAEPRIDSPERPESL
ncbi:MAG: acriflavin resistance protein [Planctomycetaceae bacterium]|jgi:HAE1 family hydrophobic/amphiphilic exporter-1|nr:acriflavin resistance protein [Planctomycetaceae bacterium]MDP7276143.1 efflux RND transporter permease subunit [Planctomycetaceae bacterium]